MVGGNVISITAILLSHQFIFPHFLVVPYQARIDSRHVVL